MPDLTTPDLTGKRVRFTRDVYEAATGDSPGGYWATKGQTGTVIRPSSGAWAWTVEKREGYPFGVTADEIEVIE